MKKIFMTLTAGATLAAAIILTSCNNAEEVKKQTDAQNAAIQSAVDAKLNGLQDQVNAECTAMVDSLVNVKMEEIKAEAAKGKGKVKPKTKPKPEAKKEAKKEETGNTGKKGTSEQPVENSGKKASTGVQNTGKKR